MKIGLLHRPVQRQAARGGGRLRRRSRLRDGRARRLARDRTTSTRTALPRIPPTGRASRRCSPTAGIEISALSNHLFSQMVLPFSDASLDEWAGTSDKEEMVKLGTEHIIKTAEVASELEIPTVCGFFGSTVWESWYIWPPQRLAIYEEGWELFVERWSPILDRFKELGVRFAHEVPPDRDRLQRLHGRGGDQAARPRRLGLQLRSEPPDLADDRPGRLHQEVRQPDLPRPREGLGAPEGHPAHRRRHEHRLVAAPRPRRPLPRTGLGRRRVEARHDGPARGRLRLRALVRARGSGHVRGGRLRAVHPVPEAADHQEAARARLHGLVAAHSSRPEAKGETHG